MEKLLLQAFPVHRLNVRHLSCPATLVANSHCIETYCSEMVLASMLQELHELAGNAYNCKASGAAYVCAFAACDLEKFNEAVQQFHSGG